MTDDAPDPEALRAFYDTMREAVMWADQALAQPDNVMVRMHAQAVVKRAKEVFDGAEAKETTP